MGGKKRGKNEPREFTFPFSLLSLETENKVALLSLQRLRCEIDLSLLAYGMLKRKKKTIWGGKEGANPTRRFAPIGEPREKGTERGEEIDSLLF